MVAIKMKMPRECVSMYNRYATRIGIALTGKGDMEMMK